MYFVILGPRRSGTNYLSELLLQNTDFNLYKIAHLDKSEIPRTLINRKISLNHILGSKHSLTDVPIEKKINPNNINIFIARRDFCLWVNSMVRYKKTYRENFVFDENELELLFNEYLDYFKVLNNIANPENYIIIFHEDLSSNKLYKISEKLNFKLKKNIKEINYKMQPGGYKKKFSIFEKKIQKYDNKSETSKLVYEKYGRFIGDQYDPIDFLNSLGLDNKNLPILKL